MFDYGHTLLYEPNFDMMRSVEAAFPYITHNPQQLTISQINAETQRVFEAFQVHRNAGVEIHEWQFMRLVYESLGIQFSISYPELEELEWNACSQGAVMPNVETMLAYLYENGIRIAVISNIGWSGQALTNRINRLLPNNHFEFIMASSEYVIRKPNKMLFDVALRKAGLAADKVWYCGDSMECDVIGSHSAGIYPVLYEGITPDEVNPYAHQNDGIEVDFDYLHIHDWRELIELLERG